MKAKNISTGIDTSRIQQNLPAFFISWTYKSERFYVFRSVRSTIETIKQGLLKNPELYSTKH